MNSLQTIGVIGIGTMSGGSAQICGAPNAKGFAKLHDLMLLHLTMREESVDSVGPAQNTAMENYLVERLRTSFPDVLRGWPPA